MKTFILFLLLFFPRLLFAQIESLVEKKYVQIDGSKYSFEVYFGNTIPKLKVFKLSSRKWKSVLNHKEYFSDFKIIDWNKDGFKDILLNRIGNTDFQMLYLYFEKEQKFRFVQDFELFPEAKSVGRSKIYFYAYQRGGCADDYWYSDLFKIIDFKAIKIGRITGNECEEPKSIKVIKFQKNEHINIDNLPVTELYKSKNMKWGFIKKYWENNLYKFI